MIEPAEDSPVGDSSNRDSPAASLTAPVAPIELASTRRLLTVAFELLGRSNPEMRRASFYIGSIVLGTVGPFALALWAISVVGFDRSPEQIEQRFETGGGAAIAVAGFLALAGILVAIVESRVMAAAILGARMSGRPISPRHALARSRMVFWRAVVAAIIVAIPLGIAQGVASAIVAPLIGEAADFDIVTTTLVTATIGAPFAYVLTGVVLGDVDPFEAVRRSFLVFRPRKLAAALVVTFETVAALLIVLGLDVGLDVILRVLDAFGLGVESGPLGLAIVTAGVVASVFAAGTLIFTVLAITIAPQVVMFVGLTHTTIGLDRIRAGGSHDPDGPIQQRRRRFRIWTRAMLVGFVIGGVVLAVAVWRYAA